MRDRKPGEGKAGRMLIVPEDGSSSFHAFVYMADEPTDEGTPLNKANFLSDETELELWGSTGDRTVNEAFSRLAPAARLLKFIQSYTVAGAYEWTVPSDGDYIAVIIGGGGAGGAACGGKATGGAAGYVSSCRVTLAKGDVIALVVGAGGTSATTDYYYTIGNPGGTSSFNRVIAEGGGGGNADSSNAADGAEGGQPSCYHGITAPIPFGGVSLNRSEASGAVYTVYGTPIPAIFLDENGLPISCLCAGGNVNQTETRPLPNGKTMSAGMSNSDTDVSAVAPTDCGAGGGAACGSEGYNVTSAPGADGGVFIYRVMGGEST